METRYLPVPVSLREKQVLGGTVYKHAFVALCLLCVSALAFLIQPSIASAQDPFDPQPYPGAALVRAGNNPCASLSLSRDTWRADLRAFKPLPSLEEFVRSVMNGQAGVVTGVYACNLLALKVAQQPVDDPVFVSTTLETATQFRLAANYGTIGLLAHNDRAGAQFFGLLPGQEVDIIYGDGAIRRFAVSGVQHFRTLDATNPYSNFVNLDNGGGLLSSTQVFQQIYTAGNQVVFQTCIEGNGNPSWGRLFVTAMPMLVNVPMRQTIF